MGHIYKKTKRDWCMQNMQRMHWCSVPRILTAYRLVSTWLAEGFYEALVRAAKGCIGYIVFGLQCACLNKYVCSATQALTHYTHSHSYNEPIPQHSLFLNRGSYCTAWYIVAESRLPRRLCGAVPSPFFTPSIHSFSTATRHQGSLCLPLGETDF